MYKVGDAVWYASCDTRRQYTQCLECFGIKYVTVILGDDSRVTIDCAGCGRGYEPPTGYIAYFERTPEVRKITIDRVQVTKDKIEYGFSGCYCVEADRLFNTEAEAWDRANALAEQLNQEELEKIKKKEKPNRTWAWNAHYHRNCIRRAERDIRYHTKSFKQQKGKKGYSAIPMEVMKLFRDWDERPDEYRRRLFGHFEKVHAEGGLTQEEIDELEALLRID